MATIKAKAEITIFNVKDVKSVTRYYLLQSSTATAPAKPTANLPVGNGLQLSQATPVDLPILCTL